jgi:hypothetical protein
MSERLEPSASTTAGDQITRRAAMFELGGIAVVFAVVIGAVVTTAKPIPNPPRRKTLDSMMPGNPSTEEQLPEIEQEERRAGRKRSDRKSRHDRVDEEQPASTTEQRASQP